jgi:hypothetical protein
MARRRPGLPTEWVPVLDRNDEGWPLAATFALRPDSMSGDFSRVGKALAEAIAKDVAEDHTVRLPRVRVLNLLYNLAWGRQPEPRARYVAATALGGSMNRRSFTGAIAAALAHDRVSPHHRQRQAGAEGPNRRGAPPARGVHLPSHRADGLPRDLRVPRGLQ